MTRGEISGRIDVNFWRLSPLFHERFSHPRYPAVPLGTIVELVQYGCSSRATETPIGVPMLRMNNLQNDGWDLRDLKFISMEEEELARYRLEFDDLLFNRTNSKDLVGKCDVFRETGDWVFASYLIRVRLDTATVLPQFASYFLTTPAGRLQIDRLSRQIIGMTNINAEELKDILIPLPPRAGRQQDLVVAMDLAREERRAKLAEAEALITDLSQNFMAMLGLDIPARDSRKTFAVRLDELLGRKIGVGLYSPALKGFLGTLSQSPFPTNRLGMEAEINPAVDLSALADDSSVSFIPMDAVENNAAGGVILETRALSEVRKGYTPFAEGDVLWAKITPCMENGKSCIARNLTSGIGFGSTEFHVLRPASERVTAEYLYEFVSQAELRSIARFAFTGSAGHQRVPSEFLADLPFPVPPLDIQEKIAFEARQRRAEARRLRAEAEAGWEAAKRWFEEQLLGPFPEA